MDFNEFKDLIENSKGDIELSSDVIFNDVLDDFCENGKDIPIEVSADGITIDGKGHTIDAKYREIFHITGTDITIKNLNMKKSTGYKGAIFNKGSLHVENCNFEECTILNEGPLTITDSKFEKNIWCIITNRSTLVIENSDFEENKQILENKSFCSTTFINCKFDNNIPIREKYLIDGYASYLTIKNCIFDNNGKIKVSSLYIENSCFKNNDTEILLATGTLKIANSTFKDNDALQLANTNDIYCENSSFSKNIGPLTVFDTGHIINCNFENKNDMGQDYDILCYKNLTLINTSFNGRNENIILCDGELNIKDCKFKKHHKINDESVFEVSKKESEFLKKLK